MPFKHLGFYARCRQVPVEAPLNLMGTASYTSNLAMLSLVCLCITRRTPFPGASPVEKQELDHLCWHQPQHEISVHPGLVRVAVQKLTNYQYMDLLFASQSKFLNLVTKLLDLFEGAQEPLLFPKQPIAQRDEKVQILQTQRYNLN